MNVTTQARDGEILRRITRGATHAEVADALGCSTKTVQRALRRALAPRPPLPVVVLCPTEELADEFAKVLRKTTLNVAIGRAEDCATAGQTGQAAA